MLIRPVPLLAIAREREDPIDARRFVDAYSRFVREVLDGKPESGGYRQWIVDAVEKRGGYARCYNAADIERRIRFSRRLISSIRRHGVRVPLVIWQDEHGIEIDGWHRTIIAAECGFESIPFRLRQGETLPEELEAAVIETNLIRGAEAVCACLFLQMFRVGSWIDALTQ